MILFLPRLLLATARQRRGSAFSFAPFELTVNTSVPQKVLPRKLEGDECYKVRAAPLSAIAVDLAVCQMSRRAIPIITGVQEFEDESCRTPAELPLWHHTPHSGPRILWVLPW